MKKSILLIVLTAIIVLTLGACSQNNVGHNGKDPAGSGKTTSVPSATTEDKGTGANEEKPVTPEGITNGPTKPAEEPAKGVKKTGYNDFINSSKNDEITEWTEVSSLVLTDGKRAAAEKEVACGEKFLGWTLKSASMKNYGSNSFGVQASFSGEATAVGTVEYNKDQSGHFENKIVFTPEGKYDSLFPKAALEAHEGFMFIIDDSAKNMLGISDKPTEFKAEIVISEYNIFYAPMGGAVDRVKITKADLIK